MQCHKTSTHLLSLARQEKLAVPCKACGSDKQAKFTAEIAIHFPGLSNLGRPHLLLFPETLICLNCGNAEFTVPESQLHMLANDAIPK